MTHLDIIELLFIVLFGFALLAPLFGDQS